MPASVYVHSKLLRNIDSALHSRPLLNRRQPLLNLGELLRRNTSPLGPVHPREARDVSDTVLAADDPQALACGFLRFETVVQDLVEALAFILVTVDAVLDLFWGVAVEVVCWGRC